MKKSTSKKTPYFLTLLAFCISLNMLAADIYIGSGATLHYAGGDFKSGVIDNTNGGTFSISASYSHSATNYVNGTVTITKTGTYDVALGDKSTETKPSLTTTGSATISYDATAVPEGTVTVSSASDYVLASKEIYSFTGDISAITATPLSTTTFSSGASGNAVLVYANTQGQSSAWADNLTSSRTKMTFAKQDISLDFENFDINTFSLFPNPVSKNATNIQYSLPENVNQLSATIYDLKGNVIATHDNLSIKSGVNSIAKPNVAKGVYIAKFILNNGAKQITKKVIID